MAKVLPYLLWLLFGAFGLHAAARLKEKQVLLEKLVLFLCDVRLALDYTCPSLPSLLEQLYAQESYRNFDFVSVLHEQLVDREFPTAWETAVNSLSTLSPQAHAHLLRLGAFLGTTDKKGQLEILQREIDWFCVRQADAAEKRKKYATLCRVGGVFSGFAVFVIMI